MFPRAPRFFASFLPRWGGLLLVLQAGTGTSQAGWLFGRKEAPPEPPPVFQAPVMAPQPLLQAPPTRVDRLVFECQRLATAGLRYKFGGKHPGEGGMDCSGVVQFVFGTQGLRDFPRLASDQFLHLHGLGTMTFARPGTSADWILRHVKPGDLLFWRGTYPTGRWPDVSHVMVYLGIDRRTGRAMMFGAASSRKRGQHGNGVDIFEFHPAKTDRGTSAKFLGFASVPGINVPWRLTATR